MDFVVEMLANVEDAYQTSFLNNFHQHDFIVDKN
jgi:hypothetical protein